jgi:transcription elongation factor
MNDIIVRPKNKAQIKALKEIFKKMDIEFEDVRKEIYNPEFIHVVINAKKEAEIGMCMVVDVDNL